MKDFVLPYDKLNVLSYDKLSSIRPPYVISPCGVVSYWLINVYMSFENKILMSA